MTFSFATNTFSVSRLPAVEALNIFVWVLIRFHSWACSSLLAFALVTILALPLSLPFPFVQSSDVHWLRSVHQCCSHEHNVADLFADRCVRVESSDVIRTSESLAPLCTSATCNGSTSGVPLLDSNFWTRRSRVSSEPRVSSVEAYDKICTAVSGSCSFTPSVSPVPSSVLRAPDSHHVTRTQKSCVLMARSADGNCTMTMSPSVSVATALFMTLFMSGLRVPA